MGEPIRIAQVLNRMDSGGVESVVMNYYRHIDHTSVQFDFYFYEGSHFPQQEELEKLGAGIYKIPAYTKLCLYQRILQKAFRARGYKIVHAHMNTMSVFPLFAAWRAGVPIRICHSHSTASWSEGNKTLLKHVLRTFNKMIANRWFACGERAGRWMYGDRAFQRGKVIILPNAIDGARFAYDSEARRALRVELSIPERAFVVGHVGRFTYSKNHPFLIEIFQQILKFRPDAYLLLVGEGETEEKIRSLVKQKDMQKQVIFTGVRHDVNMLYSVMDVFCLPSCYEGFPVVLVEAQANGLPCVISRAVTSKCIVRGNVRCLELTQSSTAWAAAIEENTQREEGSLELLETFDIHSCASKLKDYYVNEWEKGCDR